MNKILIVAILLLASFTAQSADDSGWNKTRWGMTTAQILEVYPEAKPLAKPESYKLDGEIFNATHGIERFELVAQIYRVIFLINAKNTLGGVILIRKDTSPLTFEAQTLEKLLVQKYGPGSAPKSSSIGTAVTWNPAGMNITLNNLTEPFNGEYSIRLVYLRPNTESLNKL